MHGCCIHLTAPIGYSESEAKYYLMHITHRKFSFRANEAQVSSVFAVAVSIMAKATTNGVSKIFMDLKKKTL